MHRIFVLVVLMTFCPFALAESSPSDEDLEAEIEESGVQKSSIPVQAPAVGRPADNAGPLAETGSDSLGISAESDPSELSLAPSVPAAPEQPAPVATLFDVEANPGRGTLTLVAGQQTEVLKFGSDAGGLYALGLVFDTKVLPQPYRSEYGRNVVLQVVLGRLPSKTEGQVPQFGSLALLNQYIPSGRTTFPIKSIRSRKKTQTFTRRALLMVSPPSAAAERTDEENLRSTYFGIAGSITATPVGKKREVTLSAEGDRLSFRSQIFELDFDAAIGTPFNPVDANVRGKIEFPVYWPKSPKAQAMIDSIAEQAMTGPDVKFALPKRPRSLSSESKKKPTRRRP